MKYSRWPLVLAALAFCMLLASPMNADAASQSAPSDQKHSNATPHASQKSSRDTETRKSKREKSSDKSASSHSSRSKRDKAESRSKSKQRKSSSTASLSEKERRDSTDSRDIWLKRAQESEIMSGKANEGQPIDFDFVGFSYQTSGIELPPKSHDWSLLNPIWNSAPNVENAPVAQNQQIFEDALSNFMEIPVVAATLKSDLRMS